VSASGVTAVVLAARGGARLARAAASVAWADERVVWDPAGRLEPGAIPPATRHVTGAHALATLGTAPWLLLLEEEEALDAAGAATIAAAPRAASGPDGYRLARAVEAFGRTLRVGGAPVRLARRAEARLEFGAGLGVRIAVPGPTARLAVTLHARRAAHVGDTLDDLDADGAALAALLYAGGRRARLRSVVTAPLAAGTRLLFARAGAGLGWGRWIVSVLGGYRAMVVYAKLWEVERRRVAVPW